MAGDKCMRQNACFQCFVILYPRCANVRSDYKGEVCIDNFIVSFFPAYVHVHMISILVY